MDPPPVQYVATSDGVNIAYSRIGDGSAIIFASDSIGVLANYSSGGNLPFLLIDGLVRVGKSVVVYDRRGAGASDRNVTDLSLPARLLDLQAVVSKLELSRFALAAWSQATPTAVGFACENPGIVSQLILIEPWLSEATDPHAVPAARIYNSLVDAMKGLEKGESGVYFEAITRVLNNESPADVAATLKSSLTPDGLVAFNDASRLIDTAAMLPRITTPTVVIQCQAFPFASVESCRKAAAAIPGARLLDAADGGAQAVVRLIDAFLAPPSSDPKATTASPGPSSSLSIREVEVLRLVAAGKTNTQIADELVISLNTVRRHVSNILAKTGAANRADAVSFAHRNGLV